MRATKDDPYPGMEKQGITLYACWKELYDKAGRRPEVKRWGSEQATNRCGLEPSPAVKGTCWFFPSWLDSKYLEFLQSPCVDHDWKFLRIQNQLPRPLQRLQITGITEMWWWPPLFSSSRHAWSNCTEEAQTGCSNPPERIRPIPLSRWPFDSESMLLSLSSPLVILRCLANFYKLIFCPFRM